MKKIHVLICMIALLSVTSCVNLDLNPPSAASSENWFSSPEEVRISLNDFYRSTFFVTEEGETVGAISYASNFDFLPSTHGVLIHFNCEDIEQTLEKVLLKGGKVVIPRTKIEADGKGWFAVFTDSEGNRIGIYAEK